MMFPRKPAFAVMAAMLGMLGTTAEAWAADCKDGSRVTLSGTVSKPEIRDGKLSFDVISPSPCKVEGVLVKQSNPPKSCVEGAKFTASGGVVYFIDLLLQADSVTCQ